MRFVRCTLVQVIDQCKILLGKKKRGFGVGKWNGFGGKVEPGETLKQGAARELFEESGLKVSEDDLTQIGILLFEFVGEDFLLEVNVFKASKYAGTVTESDEMKPCWFPVDQVPFDTMWADDRYWYPWMFDNKLFYGFMRFKGHDVMLEKDLNIVSGLKEMIVMNEAVLSRYILNEARS